MITVGPHNLARRLQRRAYPFALPLDSVDRILSFSGGLGRQISHSRRYIFVARVRLDSSEVGHAECFCNVRPSESVQSEFFAFLALQATITASAIQARSLGHMLECSQELRIRLLVLGPQDKGLAGPFLLPFSERVQDIGRDRHFPLLPGLHSELPLRLRTNPQRQWKFTVKT